MHFLQQVATHPLRGIQCYKNRFPENEGIKKSFFWCLSLQKSATTIPLLFCKNVL